MALKVAHLSVSDHSGGAARAAGSIHLALLAAGIESRMFVPDTPSLQQSFSFSSRFDRVLNRLNPDGRFGWMVWGSSDLHSVALVPTKAEQAIQDWGPDILHLHWVGRRTASIAQLGRLMEAFPTVWSFHDMWPITGTAHYTEEGSSAKWRSGYKNRTTIRNYFDIDFLTFHRKAKHWKTPGIAVAPALWMENLIQESALMSDWEVATIPYPINKDVFAPAKKSVARTHWNLPQDKRIILFGASGGPGDPRKGWDLLMSALGQLATNRGDFLLAVFGKTPKLPAAESFPIVGLGAIKSDQALAEAYRASDVVALPSRQDNFPLTGMEAISCGRKVVAFNIGGLSTMLKHQHNGFLARPFSTEEFAKGIDWALGDGANCSERAHPVETEAPKAWTPEHVAQETVRAYQQLMNQ